MITTTHIPPRRLLLATGIVSAVLLTLGASSAFADTVGPITFETTTYTTGTINGQDGWLKTGAFDAMVATTSGAPVSFAAQSLRISDAVTSGSFGYQTYAKPLVDSAGEASSTNGTFSAGAKKTHFEMQFDIASVFASLQAGMHMAVSPDRGDGSRMSYLRFEDQTDGIHVFFDDVTDAGPIGTVANFNETDIATISRGAHTIKLTIDFVDGAGNDVVKVYIDGILKITGTTWEDYYRFDPEAATEQSPRIVKTVLFRESGTANPTDAGNGFLVDNFSMIASSPVAPTPKVVIAKYIDGVHASTSTSAGASFPMTATWTSTGPNGNVTDAHFTLSPTPWGGIGNPYEATYTGGVAGDNYATNEITTDGNAVVGASCTDGTPFALVGYSTGDSSAAAQAATTTANPPAFTNLQSDMYVIVRNKTCPQYVQVHIIKYVDGVHATLANASSSTFTMQATYNGTTQEAGTISGSNPYTLNSTNSYEANTLHFVKGFSYSTSENMDATVGATCAAGKPYAIDGYKVGTSLAAAQAAAATTTAPNMTNIQSQEYIIVLNKTCAIAPALGTISGMKYNDLNRNGKKDANEPGLKGWVIRLSVNRHVVMSTTTAADGTYSFPNLAPGTYTLRETHQYGWKRESKNPKPIVIVAGATVTDVTFGNSQKHKEEREDNDGDDNRDDQQGQYMTHRGMNDYRSDR